MILREHVPISNLFSCLWFNEVDRFTSRDQISFSTVRDKLMAKTNWTLYMFLDCERRNFVIQVAFLYCISLISFCRLLLLLLIKSYMIIMPKCSHYCNIGISTLCSD